jgi:quinol monooxygenase YgiN
MIVIHARISTEPGTVEALRSAVAAMEQASRAEAGCLAYVFAAAVSDPNTLHITEEWRDVEALKAHFQTPHMATFQAAMRQHPPRGMEVKAFEAKEVPFPTV